jgi:hypothetical protein
VLPVVVADGATTVLPEITVEPPAKRVEPDPRINAVTKPVPVGLAMIVGAIVVWLPPRLMTRGDGSGAELPSPFDCEP